MNHHLRSLVLAVVALSSVIFSEVSPAGSRYEQQADKKQKIEGRNDTGCIELIEAKIGATECKNPNALAIRAKVKCDKPTDVKICAQNVQGRWLCGEYRDKNAGDEISYYECYPNGRYAIFKRDVGSKKDWPKP